MASAEDCFFGGSVHQDGESSRSRANVDGTPLGTIFFSYFTSSLGICGRRSSFLFFVLLWVSTMVKNNSKSLNAQRLKNRDVYRLIMILGTKVENETLWSGFQTLLLVCSLSSRTNPYRHLMPRFVCNLE